MFICNECERNNLTFNETHTKMHTVLVSVSEEAEKERSTEERLQCLENELTTVRQTVAEMKQCLETLVGKSGKEVLM